MLCALVVPAAGGGTRFGGAAPKQLLPLAGRAVLLRSLHAFAGLVVEAVIPVAAAIHEQVAELLMVDPPPFPCRLVIGGDTRQASVHAGLEATDAGCDAVLVHDAARPLVREACIRACIKAIARHGAAVVCQPCSSTVKRAVGDLVVATVPREDLWLAQTPQGFRRELGLTAYRHAAAEGWIATDDAAVIEHAGHPVAVVPGEASNLKITTPDDWAVAEALVDLRER
jgi:2-C-methyl-D-erythritol 4-phosphate cytidylyltransferase